jgi:hypothetical protein
MYTTTNEQGILNNYPTEPQVYCAAAYPEQEQQRLYTYQAAVASVFVTAIILVALGVS